MRFKISVFVWKEGKAKENWIKQPLVEVVADRFEEEMTVIPEHTKLRFYNDERNWLGRVKAAKLVQQIVTPCSYVIEVV